MPPTALPSADALFGSSALDLAGRIADGVLTARAVVAAHIRQVRDVDAVVNAVTAERFEAALADADAVDAARRRDEPLPRLAGVPFTVKEMVSLAGLPHTLGSLRRQHDVADADATVVARLRAAGAIPLCTTNVPEWGFWFETENLIYGRTANPRDPRRSAGGSSGGEGALVGSGASPFGIGSDIGGSIRIPAAFCGAFGHKPTHGLVPLTGHYPVYAGPREADAVTNAPYLAIGPITRRASDLMPLLRIMAGPDGIDPNARAIALADTSVRWKDVTVVVLDDPRIRFVARTSPDARRAVRLAAGVLRAAGARIVACERDIFRDAIELWAAALRGTGSPAVGLLAGVGRPRDVGRALASHALRRPTHTLPILLFSVGEWIAGWRTRNVDAFVAQLDALARRFRRLLGDDGILLMPAHPRAAPRHRSPMLRPFDFAHTAIFNALRVPATVAPVTATRAGLPLAVQIAAPAGDDHRTIAAAELLDAALRH